MCTEVEAEVRQMLQLVNEEFKVTLISILTELRGTEYKHKGMRNVKSEKNIILFSKKSTGETCWKLQHCRVQSEHRGGNDVK